MYQDDRKAYSHKTSDAKQEQENIYNLLPF